MKHTLYIASRYMAYHRVKSALLILALALILYLPLALQLLSLATERNLLARASASPLVLGARGSSLDLVIEALYFQRKGLRTIYWSDYVALRNASDATLLPVYTRFHARDITIVGCTLAYFEKRGLHIADGNPLRQLGECVLGARAAQSLDLRVGDSLLSTPENLFDIAGTYPLKMKVVGILAPSESPDDLAIFVDIKTAWVIEGLGHGHEDMAKVDDPDLILKQSANKIAANAKLQTYNEITPENLESFHFHGDMGDFPISAVLCFPKDRKNEDLLRGHYLENANLQMVKAENVIENLNATLFRIRSIMNAGIGLVGAATLLLVALVFALSLRLRKGEIQTLHKLGAARGALVGLLIAEMLIISGIALSLAAGLALLTHTQADTLMHLLMAYAP